MLLLASLPLIALALALEEDLRRLPKCPPETAAECLDPTTGSQLSWSISNPRVLFSSLARLLRRSGGNPHCLACPVRIFRVIRR